MTVHQAFLKLTEALTEPYGLSEARSVARILMEDAFAMRSPEEERLLSAMETQQWEAQLRRLLAHEPVQYILGEADFYGLKFNVNPAVLIPRPETEELVYWMEKILKKEKNRQGLRILDIGTGSGCIPVVLKKRFPELEIEAIDISADVLRVAKHNASRHGVDIQFYQNNILDETRWSQLPQYHYIVSNPPYIPHGENPLMGSSVRRFEPETALYVPDDQPLLFYEKIVDFAQCHLYPGGQLFFECNEYRAQAIADLLKEKEFSEVLLKKDLQEKDRMLKARFDP